MADLTELVGGSQISQGATSDTKMSKKRNSGHLPRWMAGVDLYEHFALKIEPSTERSKGDKAIAPRMDWLFTDEAAATLIVIVGASLFAIVWHLYGP
jgi:hypothetical protein